MPVALVVLLLDITLIYHASRTGRLQPWAFIILMIPLVGALAYIVVELVPEWFGSPGAQQARKRIAGKLDPEKLYRELSDRLAGTDTIANRAGACSRVSEDRAIRRSRAALRSHPRHCRWVANRPMRWARRRPQFGRNRPADALATLDDLQKRMARF